jgi:hypothetical protein
MSGKTKIINGQVAQSKVRGKALGDALAQGLVKNDEKSSSYQKAQIDGKNDIHKKMAI